MELYRDSLGWYSLPDCENGHHIDITILDEAPFRKYLNPETGEIVDSRTVHEKYIAWLSLEPAEMSWSLQKCHEGGND